MKSAVQLLKLTSIIIFCGMWMLACKKNSTTSNPPPVNTGNSANADSISDRLQFLEATKKQGTIPAGPSGSSLKISFEDTLYLVDQIKMPIKFRHLDTTQNVAGIFLQVEAVVGGPIAASYYYDVPEVPQIGDSTDTVSLIMIGVDPTNLKFPLSFNITIIPYNSSGQPIAHTIRPVKIVEHTNDPKANSGSCGLILPPDEVWDWELSYINSPTSDFYSDPNTVFGGEGQIIRGNCCGGTSVYGICPREREPNEHLHFNTYYQITSEHLLFVDPVDFARETTEQGANPLPDSSNFCDPFEGLVRPYVHGTLYSGTYSITPAVVPPDLQMYHDSLRLGLLTTAINPRGAGFGNPGGIIHFLDCKTGALVLIQVDLEGFGQHLIKIYKRNTLNLDRWFALE